MQYNLIKYFRHLKIDSFDDKIEHVGILSFSQFRTVSIIMIFSRFGILLTII